MSKTIRLTSVFMVFAALAIAALLTTGCQSNTGGEPRFAEWGEAGSAGQGAGTAAPAQPGAGATVLPPGPRSVKGDYDILREGDNLIINISDLPIKVEPIEEKIKEDGTITLLENQTFKAAGKKRGDLEKEVRERYVPRIFRKMTVSIKHAGTSQFFFVGGEVKQPNRQVYISRMTVLKAIQSAGDFTDFANKKKVTLTRLDGTTMVVNCAKALQDPSLDVEVVPGDRIYVPRRFF